MEVLEVKSGLRKPVVVRAVEKYTKEACVSLVPKTNLVKHYMHKYHMVHKGRHLCLEDETLNYILKKYFYV